MKNSYIAQAKIDGETCMLEIVNTDDQEEYIAPQMQRIRDGEGFVLVYSVTSRFSFVCIEKLHRQIIEWKDWYGPLAGINPHTHDLLYHPIKLVGNNSDGISERQITTAEGQELARKLGCEFVEVSAKNFINVEKAFYDVIRLIRLKKLLIKPSWEEDSFDSKGNSIFPKQVAGVLAPRPLPPRRAMSPRRLRAELGSG
jgi:GTPase KRas